MLALLLPVVMSVTNIDFPQLEKYYWVCDTKYMLQTMSGQDYNSCVAITDEFQKYFVSRDEFISYWNSNNTKQWASRGYILLDKKAE